MNLTLVLYDEMQVRACNPNLGILAGWHQTGVIVTAAAMTPGIDFVSRFFAPQSGIPEDPVTGSTHRVLAQGTPHLRAPSPRLATFGAGPWKLR
jgi:predicted PhzF superfamily epimerase YddE/YHI9